jgi:hypothetical protein
MRHSSLKKWYYSTYPSNNPGKLGKTGEKLGISAGALIRPVKEQIITLQDSQSRLPLQDKVYHL